MHSYDLHIVPGGRERGIAIYVKEEFSEFIEEIDKLDYGNIQALKVPPCKLLVPTFLLLLIAKM